MTARAALHSDMRTISVKAPAWARTSATATSRFWEIDLLRGLAIVAMVFFHLMWDLWFFGLTDQNIASARWQAFARSIGSTFIFVMGLSLALTAYRLRMRDRSFARWALRRSAIVFAYGMVISAATFLFVGSGWVRFGILHHAGAAIVFSILFVDLRWWINMLLGAGVLVIGAYLNTLSAPIPWLIPIGVVSPGVIMVDYYPLLPWFGMALLGIAAGKALYPKGQRRFAMPDLSASAPIRALGLMGRHSLLIYLVHQPILIGALLLLQWFRIL